MSLRSGKEDKVGVDGIELAMKQQKELDELRSQICQVRSEVNHLQSKLDWYENAARWIACFAFTFMMNMALQKGQFKSVAHRYGEAKTDSSVIFGRLMKNRGSNLWERDGIITEIFDDQSLRVDGLCKNGKMEWFATMDVPWKYRYEGEVKDGNFHGYGSLIEGNFTYHGNFANHVKSGFGSLRHSNGDLFEGQFVKGRLNDTAARVSFPKNQSMYIGSFSSGTFNGYGTMISLLNGTRVTAIWKDGRAIDPQTTHYTNEDSEGKE